jgi:hypothetical protein
MIRRYLDQIGELHATRFNRINGLVWQQSQLSLWAARLT